MTRATPRPALARRVGLATLIAVLLGATLPVAATTYRQLAVSEMLARTEVAFYGEVLETRVELRDGQPWTVVAFRIERAFRGVNRDPFDLAFLGGDLPGGPTLTVNLMPRFEVGERLLLLAYDDAYASPVVGFRQGLWRERDDQLVDETGRVLGLGDDGSPVADGAPATLGELLDAIGSAFGDEESAP